MNRADISADLGMTCDGVDSAGFGGDVLPSHVTLLRAVGNHSPPIKSRVTIFPTRGWKTGRKSSCGLTGVIWVCSSTLKNPRSPSSPELSSSSQTSMAPGQL